MNYQSYNNYNYHKSKVVWWLHRRVDNEYFKKAKYGVDFTENLERRNLVAETKSTLIQTIIEDLK